MSSSAVFSRGERVMVRYADDDYSSGTLEAVAPSISQHVTTTDLVVIGLNGGAKAIVHTSDLFKYAEYHNQPQELPYHLDYHEADELDTKAVQMFKALNERGFAGRHHMSSGIGLDEIREKFTKKGRTLYGVAWTDQQGRNKYGAEPYGMYGACVNVTASNHELTQEQYAAEREAVKQAVIEEATKVGLYVVARDYGLLIGPRYYAKAVNAEAVYSQS